MLAQAKLKLRNAESSIAFMQEQHAKTLQDLHCEIQKLQKKNARLTFEVAMTGPPPSTPGSSKCGECKQLEECLTSSKAEILKLSSALSSNEDRLKMYEHQLQDVMSKYSEEMNTKDDKLARQNADLETKSSNIASLTQQLYNTRLRLRSEIETAARIASGAICKCPQCRVHGSGNNSAGPSLSQPLQQPIANDANMSVETRTPRTSRIERRRVRTVSSPVPESTVSNSNVEHEVGSAARSRRLPTPPTLPRPPSESSIRRASIPVRRQFPSSSSLARESTASTASLPGGHHHVRQQDNVEQRTLDPVRAYKYSVVPPDIRNLLHSRDGSVRISSKPAPPVLPPISDDSSTDAGSQADFHEDTQSTQSLEYASYSELPTRIRPAHKHRHFILAQAQGLSSAPSTMRVVHYNRHSLESTHEDLEAGRREDGDSERAVEGTLLVRETVNRKDQAWQELHQHGTK